MTEKLHIFLHFIFFLSLFSRNTAFLTFDRSENRSIIGSNDKLEQVTSNNTYIRITDLAIKPAIREKCIAYREKALLSFDNAVMSRNITLLTSFPGSGNTLTRLLVEAATGGFTGSVYTSDSDLAQVFEMESRCGLRMVAIKGHPDSFEVCGTGLCIRSIPEYRKCKAGLITKFHRFIFVARNPIDNVFAEFQRVVTSRHNGRISSLDIKLITKWQLESIRIAKEISDGWKSIISPMINRYSPQDFLVMKYENLISKDDEVRFTELMPVPQFLMLPYDEARIDCAFEMANSVARVHRNSTLHYNSLLINNDDLACQLWSLFRNYSDYFGYANPWPELICDQTKPLSVRNQCLSYHERSYLEETSLWNRSSTLLTGFEGSGMSWVRALIEYSTGVYTGSIYSSDTDLLDVFPGEARCGLRMTAMRGYPSNFDLCYDRTCLTLARERSAVAKCKKGMLTQWNRFIMVVRDPVESIVAAFQKTVTEQRIGAIKAVDDSVLDQWVSFVVSKALDFKMNWNDKLHHISKSKSAVQFHIVIYEHLLLSSPIRYQELESLGNFLQFPSTSIDRIKCAFELADVLPGIHRQSKWTFKDFMPKNKMRIMY